jgi:hypothetical protein
MEKTIVKTYRKDCFLGYDPLHLTNEVEVAVIIEYHKYRNVANLLQDNEVKSPYIVKHEVKHLENRCKIQIITEMGVFENENGN